MQTWGQWANRLRYGRLPAEGRIKRKASLAFALATALLMGACGPRFSVQAVPTLGESTPTPTAGASSAGSAGSGPTSRTNTVVIKGGAGSTVTGSVIKIGGLFPTSGGLSALGIPAEEGAAAFFAYANDQRLIPGKRFQFIPCDDQAVDSQSTTCAKKLVDEDKVFIMGPSFTPFSLSVINELARDGMPWIGFDGINIEGMQQSNVVTIGSPIEPMGHSLLDYWYRKLERQGHAPKRIGAVVLDAAPAKTYIREAKDVICPRLGCQIVVEQTVQYQTTQYETICENMRNAQVDAIWIITDPASAIKLMAQCQSFKGKFLGQHGIYLDLTLQQSGPTADGLMANSGLLPDTVDAPATRQMKAIIRNYYPDAQLGYFTSLAYASARMVVDLVAKLVAQGTPLTRANMLSAASTVTNYNCDGLCKDVNLAAPACKSGGNHNVWIVRADFSSGTPRWVREAGPFDAFNVETWPTPGKPRPCP